MGYLNAVGMAGSLPLRLALVVPAPRWSSCDHPRTPENTRNVSDQRPGGRCRICYNAYWRRWRRANPSKSRAYSRSYWTSFKQRWRVHIRQLWANTIRRRRGCIDCGTRKGRLHFDHRDPATKLGNVATMVRGHVSIAVIRAEIAKCDVRCAEHHAKRHAAEKKLLRGVQA